MKIRMLLLLLFACPALTGAETIAIKNARIYTMTGPVIENGTVVIENGKIADVGTGVTVPPAARVIDASGKTLMPGFIDTNCRIGLEEVSAVESTVDRSEETDPVTPHVRTIDAFFPESVSIGVSRRNGITACVVTPLDGNVLTGTSAIVELSGKRLDNVILKDRAAIHGTMGEKPKKIYGEKDKMPSTRMGTAALLRETLQKAREYIGKWERSEKQATKRKKDEKEPKHPDKDMKLEALHDVLSGKLPLVISAHRADDIMTAVRIAEEFGIKQNLVISHGTEAYKIADFLAKEKIPVLLGPVTTQPETMETLGAIYENAAKLNRAGVLFALQTYDSHDVRNLPYEAGIAVANGLPYEEALKALTINAARIFGVDQELGAIEKGKRANLFLADGDPLEPRTAVTHVFIGGEEMPLDSHHTEMWEKLKNRE